MSDTDQHRENEDDLAEQLGRVADQIADRLSKREPVELSEYLAKHPELADVLPAVFSSVRGLSDWHATLASADQEALEHGMQLGDFRLLRELGRGGMGIVYEAEQLSLRRRVAVKVFPFASVLEPNKLQRFKNEALAAATLEHPHIVPVLAVGEERSTHFFAMRLIAGHSLSELIDRDGEANHSEGQRQLTNTHRSPTTPRHQEVTTRAIAARSTVVSQSPTKSQARREQTVTWIRDAAEALHYAHQLGIVHRDVKPGNLLIDQEQKVWVTDFGLATGILEQSLTISGDLLGTLPYMSPEQASGNRRIVDHRTDIYSLGVSLFEALTGEKPFAGQTQAQLLQQILTEEATLSSPSWRGVPPDLTNIVLKAMAKEPTERYDTAQDFADDLSRYLRREPVIARRPSMWGRASRWVRHNRAITMATCVILACLVFATVLSQVSAHRLRKSTEIVKRHLYVADVRLASAALEQNNVVQARELLTRHLPAAGEPDLRSFAWHILWQRAHPAQFTLAGHEAEVRSVCWSPDGKYVVSADMNGQVLMWDAERGILLRRFTKWNSAIQSIRYSPNGRTLVLVDEVGQLAVFSVDTGTLERSIMAHDGVVRSLVVSPDSTKLATCGEDGMIRVWDADTLSKRWEVRSHGYRVYDIGFHGETNLVSVGHDSILRFWRIGQEQPLNEVRVGARARSLAVSRQGKQVICNTSLGELRRFRLDSGERTAHWRIASERFYEVHYSADGQLLVATGKDRLSRIINAVSGEVLQTLAGHARRVYAASFAPDGSRVATASADGTCKIYPVKNPEVTSVDLTKGIGSYAAFSLDGHYLAFADEAGNWGLRDNASGEISLLPGTHHGNARFPIDFSSGGEFLATSGGPFVSFERSLPTSRAAPIAMDLDMDGDQDLLAAVGPHFRLLSQERLDSGQLSDVSLLAIGESRAPQAIYQRLDDKSFLTTNAINLNGILRENKFIGSNFRPMRTRLSHDRCDLLLVEDLDEDGNRDVIVDQSGLDHLKIHTLTDGLAAPKTSLSFTTEGPTCVVAMHVDDDDRKDVVVADPRHSRIEWYRQVRRLEFELQGNLAEGLTRPNLLIPEDVDEDDQVDLISVDDGEVIWLRRTSPGVFMPPRKLDVALSSLKSVMPHFANTAVWSTSTRRVHAAPPALCHHPSAMAIGPMANLIAICGDDRLVHVRNVTTGEQVALLPVEMKVHSLAFSPQGQILAIAHGDDCMLWNTSDTASINTLQGHESSLNRVQFSADGQCLATLSSDMTVSLWDPQTASLQRTLLGFTGRPDHASFSSDGDTIAIGTTDGELSLWDVDTGQLLCVLAQYGGREIRAVSFRGPNELLAVVYDPDTRTTLESFTVD